MISRSEAGESAAPTRRQRRQREWVLVFLAFFLFIGAWSLAAPYDGTPDEKEHIIRAAGVVAGQVFAAPEDAVRGGGAYQTVPRSLVRDNTCWRHQNDRNAGCAPQPGGDATPVRAGTMAGRYHPLYYAIVGWPLRLSPDWIGVLLARLLSVALSAALLANALTDAMRWSRHRIMAAGVLAAVTPMAAQMASAVNPNGLEISAAVALFAAAVPLLHDPAARRSRTLLWHVGVAAFGLATLRTAGPAWLAVSVAALVLPFGWRTLRVLWGWVALRWWMLAVGLAGVLCVGWSLLFRTNEASETNLATRLTLAQAARLEVERWRRYADEMVGVLSWLDVRIPAPGYLIWQYAVGALVIWAFVVTARAGRWQLMAIAAGGLGIPYVIQVLYVNTYGFITQGRYLLPVLVGLPILAAFLIQAPSGGGQAPSGGSRAPSGGESGLDRIRGGRLVRLFAVLLLPIHLVALVFTMVRWQQGMVGNSGPNGVNPLIGAWHPPLGSAPPLLAALAGLVLLGWLVWREPLPRPDGPVPPSDGPSPAAGVRPGKVLSAEVTLADIPVQGEVGASDPRRPVPVAADPPPAAEG